MSAPEIDPQLQRRMAGHEPAHGHDTGGVPWHGRDLTPNPFSGDTGEPDPQLRSALADAAGAPGLAGSPTEAALVRAVARARFFVPVVAAPGDEAEAGTDSVADMATVVLTGPDGQRALPAFTGLDTLSGWDPGARPVPVSAPTLAQAAVQEGCDVLLLDLGSEQAAVLRASMVYALAQEREWVPAHQDVVVGEALARTADLARRDPAAGSLLAGLDPVGTSADGALQVRATVAPGLDRARLHGLLGQVGVLLSEDVALRERIDGVTFTVVPAHA